MVVSVIPARGGSKAIPKKNIIPFLGRPLITYTIHQAVESDRIDKTYVSTDDGHIADVSRDAGAQVINRPDELAGDTASTEATLLHAFETMAESPEILVLLQCTSPLRREDDIDETIRLVQDGGFDSSLTCSEDHSFYWKRQNGTAVPINYDPAERQRRQELSRRFEENGSVYVMKRELLEEDHCRLGGDIGIHEMPKELSFEIDTPEDYRIVEAIGKNVEFAAKNR
jgi:N-acylneuraminate cytidylyltransferase